MSQEDEQNGVWCVAFLYRKEAMHMLFEQVYLLFIYILFTELGIVTAVAIGLLVASIVTIRRLSSEKNTSLSGR